MFLLISVVVDLLFMLVSPIKDLTGSVFACVVAWAIVSYILGLAEGKST